MPTPPPVKIVLPDAVPHEGNGTLQMVPVREIRVLKGLNVRVDLPRLDELVASIQANGFFRDKPLCGYQTADGIIVVDGHRRLAAVEKLNSDSLDGDVIAELPVVVKPEATSLAAVHIAQVQSATGEPLTSFEKGIACRRILADGMSKEDLAKAFGVTPKSIDNYVAIASAPAKARDLLLEGKVKETHVLRAVQKKGVDAVKTLQAMVEKAATKGRKTARAGDAEKTPVVGPHDSALPPESTYRAAALVESEDVGTLVSGDNVVTVDIVKDAAMGPVLKDVAKAIRGLVPHDSGEADTAFAAGTVTITVTLVAPPKRRKKTVDPVPAELAHAVPADDEL